MSEKTDPKPIEIPHDQLSRLKQLEESQKKSNERKKEK